MKLQLKELSRQIIVITGASSGIGLTTARKAAAQGARLVLVARNEEALKELVRQLRSQGCDAIAVAADVGNENDVRNVAKAALEHFGGFDTWINNAGVSIFGRLQDVSLADHRRLFDTNFWGVVHGSLVAVEHLKWRGGSVINMGSEVSEHAVPLQGMYASSKLAVKGFTDALRMELEEESAPINVTLVRPASIDTMFVVHAKNYLDKEPQLAPPVYAPEIVADAILFAATNPKRDVYVGGASKLISSAAAIMPRAMDRLMERLLFRQQKTNEPSRGRDDNALYKPGVALHERQGRAGRVHESSLYTKAALHLNATALVMLGGAGIAIAALARSRRRSASAEEILA